MTTTAARVPCPVCSRTIRVPISARAESTGKRDGSVRIVLDVDEKAALRGHRCKGS